MSIGSYSCPTSWEGEGGSSQRGRKRRSYGLSKARGSVSRPWLLSTSRTKTNHLVFAEQALALRFAASLAATPHPAPLSPSTGIPASFRIISPDVGTPQE